MYAAAAASSTDVLVMSMWCLALTCFTKADRRLILAKEAGVSSDRERKQGYHHALGSASIDKTMVSFGMHMRLPLMSRTRGGVAETSSAYVALVRLGAGAVR